VTSADPAKPIGVDPDASFFKLLLMLKQAGRSFTICFRSFGEDLAEVADELNAFCEGRHPLFPGACLDGTDGEPDYRFFQDPDLPQITVTNERISAVHAGLGEIPFEVKKRFCNQFGMDVADVKNVFRSPWSIEMFTRLVWTLQIDPKLVYKWIYEHIFGNVEKKGLDF